MFSDGGASDHLELSRDKVRFCQFWSNKIALEVRVAHDGFQQCVNLRFCTKLRLPRFLTPYGRANPLFPVNKMQKWNHRNIVMTMPNQNSNKVLRSIQPKCLGSPISAKTKSARNAVNEYDLDKLMGNFISASRLANFLWFEPSKAKTSPRNNSVRVIHKPTIEIQWGQMAWSTPAAPAIPNEELLTNLQKYCFNERIVRTLQPEPGFGVTASISWDMFCRELYSWNGSSRTIGESIGKGVRVSSSLR
jgi:hypothetical protein